MKKIWPWSRIAQLTRERDEARDAVKLAREAGRAYRRLLALAYFRDPETGRLCPQGVRPAKLVEQARRPFYDS